MAAETVELDTTKETEVSPNGHDSQWKVFDDDQAFLSHILSKKPAEKLVEIPEWDVKVLCRAVNVADRIAIEKLCYDTETERTDYRKDFYAVVMAGCFNPVTGKKIFTESSRKTLMRNSGPIVRLAMAVLRLSGMLLSEQENARKN